MSSTLKSYLNAAEVPLEGHYLLCIDPDSKKTIKIDIGTQEASKTELMEGRTIESRIKREMYKIDKLLDREKMQTNWNFRKENQIVDDYRRSMVPFYLLGEESSSHPVYVDNSDIPMSMTGDKNLEDAEPGNEIVQIMDAKAATTIEKIVVTLSDPNECNNTGLHYVM